MSGEEKESSKRKAEPETKKDTSSKTKDLEVIQKEENDKDKCQINANKIIYFKIISNEAEFDDFQNMNLENSFQPTYTYELFANEVIHGYKGLKVLISLTPKTFFAHLNIQYAEKLDMNDDIENILALHFKERFTRNKATFISKLNEENKIIPKGKLIFSENNRKIYNVDILKDDYTEENYSIQALCTFFIDAASFIPIEENFWGYFIIVENVENKDKKDEKENWRTLGICSYKNFHIELYKYFTMLSQFLILPPYQRKGLGTFLLENIYKYLFNEDKNCLEIMTEDPSIEFILMRDYTITKLMAKEKLIDNLLNLIKDKTIEKKEEFDKFILSPDDVKKISKKLKLQDILITRAIEIIKYGLVLNSKEMLKLFEEEKKQNMTKMFEENSIENAKAKRIRGPFIFFGDDLDYNYKTDYEEKSDYLVKQKVEILYPEYIGDIEKIVRKVNEMIFNYKSTLTKNA
jgi:GNAT superfamily N-acetyltransferase